MGPLGLSLEAAALKLEDAKNKCDSETDFKASPDLFPARGSSICRRPAGGAVELIPASVALATTGSHRAVFPSMLCHLGALQPQTAIMAAKRNHVTSEGAVAQFRICTLYRPGPPMEDELLQ